MLDAYPSSASFQQGMPVTGVFHSCSTDACSKLQQNEQGSLLQPADHQQGGERHHGSKGPAQLQASTDIWQPRQHTHSCQCLGLQQDWQLGQSSGSVCCCPGMPLGLAPPPGPLCPCDGPCQSSNHHETGRQLPIWTCQAAEGRCLASEPCDRQLRQSVVMLAASMDGMAALRDHSSGQA